MPGRTVSRLASPSAALHSVFSRRAPRIHLVNMDPPHITEFASERYFNKLNRLSEPSSTATNQDAAAHIGAQASAATITTTHPQSSSPSAHPQSTFILPIRASKSDFTPDSARQTDQRPDKSRLRGLRSKVSFLHSKTSHSPDLAATDIDSSKYTRYGA